MASEKQCLILGPQSVGKTLLIRALQTLSSDIQKKEKDKHYISPSPSVLPLPTQPTTGTNLVTIETPHGPLLLKEFGGKMAPLWSRALPDANMIIYTIDSSNPRQLSSTSVLLMETLANEAVNGKPVLLFFNKTDSISSLSLFEFKVIIRVDDLAAKYGNLLSVLSGNCVNQDGGIRGVLDWLWKTMEELQLS